MADPVVNPNGPLKGRVAVVTGASRGIGEAIALRLAMDGAKVIVSARTMDEGEIQLLDGTVNQVVARIKVAGGEAAGVKCDMSVVEDRENLMKEAERIFGPVDILVNNAAVTFFIPTFQFPPRRARLMFDVQVHGPMELAQMAYDGMKTKGIGHVIYISSGAALHPQKPYRAGGGGTVYGMCKAAMERFSTGFASEVYEDNIAVNSIEPGLVATPGAVHHHLATDDNLDRQTPVESIAEAVCFIARSEPKEITGRVDHITAFMKEFNLEPVPLIK